MLTSLSPTVPVPLWNTLWNITTAATFIMDSSSEMNNSEWMNSSNFSYKHSGIPNNDNIQFRCNYSNLEFNCNVTDYLLVQLGSKQLNNAILVSFVIYY